MVISTVESLVVASTETIVDSTGAIESLVDAAVDALGDSTVVIVVVESLEDGAIVVESLGPFVAPVVLVSLLDALVVVECDVVDELNVVDVV